MKYIKKTTLFILASLLLLSTAAPAFAESSDTIRQGDILCFGEPDEVCGFDGKWLVLDAEHTNTGEDGIFLVSLNLIGDEQGNTIIYRQL